MSNGRDTHVVTPFPLAMVICDCIYRDPFTNKYTLIGTFSTVTALRFPVVHPHLFIYAALTGGRGSIPIRLILTGPDEQEIVEVGGEYNAGDDPRMIEEVGLGLPNVPFPLPGEYRLSLFANNEFMIERRLLVIQLPHGGEHDDNPE
jgi:hypothetical protein